MTSPTYAVVCDECGKLRQRVRPGWYLRLLVRWYDWRHARCAYVNEEGWRYGVYAVLDSKPTWVRP